MPQIGGKPVKKSSKTKSKSSSTSKRHFTVVIGTKEHGLYCSSSPSSAARKAVSKLCGKEKGKKVEFCLREITQGSKKKTYGPYLGHIEKLAKPIELKGRVIERKPVALLKPKSSAKKGGMRGGDFNLNNMQKGIQANIHNIQNENIMKIRNDIDKDKDISSIYSKYEKIFSRNNIDYIIAHKIVDDIYENRDNMNHYRSVLKKYSNKGFNTQIQKAQLIMRLERSLF